MSEVIAVEELEALCKEIDLAVLRFKQAMSELGEAMKIAANMEDLWKHQRSLAD